MACYPWVVDTVVVAVPADRTDEARQILGHRAMIVAVGSGIALTL